MLEEMKSCGNAFVDLLLRTQAKHADFLATTT